MTLRPPAKRPVISSLRLCDGKIVDTRETPPHQAIVVKLPVFIAIGSEPVPFYRDQRIAPSLEPNGNPGRRVIDIPTGTGLTEELPREEVGIVRDQHQVAIDFPIEFHLRLAPDIGRVAVPRCPEHSTSRIVDTIVHALPPEEIDLGRSAKLLCQLEINRGMCVDQIDWTDEPNQSEIERPGEEWIEGLNIPIPLVSIPAHEIDLEMETRTKWKGRQFVSAIEGDPPGLNLATAKRAPLEGALNVIVPGANAIEQSSPNRVPLLSPCELIELGSFAV